MTVRHFLVDDDLSAAEQAAILDEADRLKKDRLSTRALSGPRAVAVVLEKPSTRTRMSFEVGIAELGGLPVVVDIAETQVTRGETIEDTARVMSRYVAAIVMRTFAHERLEAVAAASTVPVINALTDFAHPCQALADLQTIRECKGGLAGVTLTFLGDGNNIANSLLLAGAMAGMHMRVASPPGFEPIEQVVRRATELASASGGSVAVTNDPVAAAAGADVLYTDVWSSMGDHAGVTDRSLVFQPYALDSASVDLAAKDVIVMHCMPAHRGEEIAADVLDGPRSRVLDQAENRLHAQKALLAFLVGGG